MSETLDRSTNAEGAALRRHRRAAVSTSALAALSAGAGNLAVLGAAHLGGATMTVARPAADTAMTVGPVLVVVSTAVALALGALALWITAPRGHRAWSVLGWLGLAIGVLTVVMPLSMGAEPATTVALATMHVLTGAVWFALLRHRDPSRTR